MNDVEERILDVAIEEIVRGKQPPDLTGRITVDVDRRSAGWLLPATAAAVVACAAAIWALRPAPELVQEKPPPEKHLIYELGRKAFQVSEEGGDSKDYPDIVWPEGARKSAYLTAEISADGKHWIYVSPADGDAEIYRCERDGSKVMKLTDNDSIDNMPQWTDDGKCIVFASTRSGNWQIWIMNRDGGDARQLTKHPLGAWEPCVKGAKVAYLGHCASAEKLKPSELRVTDLEGKQDDQVIESAQIVDFAWHPDGRRIVCGLVSRIDIVDVATKKVAKTFVCTIIDKGLYAHGPRDFVWKKDGNAFACTMRFLGGRMMGTSILGDREIFIIRMDGAENDVRTLKLEDNAKPIAWIP